MTRKNAGILYRNQDVLKAYAEGRTIEFKPKGEGWKSSDAFGNSAFSASENGCTFDFDSYEYRIKPEPKLREWGVRDVRIGALIQPIVKHTGSVTTPSLILDTSYRGISFIWDGAIKNLPLAEAFDNWEHSVDGGHSFHPCGVLET